MSHLHRIANVERRACVSHEPEEVRLTVFLDPETGAKTPAFAVITREGKGRLYRGSWEDFKREYPESVPPDIPPDVIEWD